MSTTRDIENALASTPNQQEVQPEIMPNRPRLIRQLSVAYRGPDGQYTHSDPNSFQGQERATHQIALLNDETGKNTGYANAVRDELGLPPLEEQQPAQQPEPLAQPLTQNEQANDNAEGQNNNRTRPNR